MYYFLDLVLDILVYSSIVLLSIILEVISAVKDSKYDLMTTNDWIEFPRSERMILSNFSFVIIDYFKHLSRKLS